MFKDNASDPLSYFRDISTFGGCVAGPAAAIENMKIIEEENLLDNCTKMGDYCLDLLHGLMDKHSVIGQVRGKGLFLGAELVTDRDSKQPVDEKLVQAVTGDCMANGVIIGATNRSVPGFNNTLCLSPALISTKDDIDQIIAAMDSALTKVFA
jgi:taurine-pyruvate aminotransferase